MTSWLRISAWEALKNGSWIATTFLGQIDYFNSKPPLMVWLIALSFKTFGPTLVSLRLASAACSWATVAVLQRWTKRCFGAVVSLLASLVLATTFGFTHLHAGRSAATDAPFTLVLLLIVVTLWAEPRRPWLRLWIGPLLAAAFMLRGMGVLMPLSLVAIVMLLRMVRADLKVCTTSDRRSAGLQACQRWAPTLSAIALFALPVGVWAVARYRIDGWTFFDHLFMYDFVERTMQPIEGHPGGPLFYLDVLQKDQYDWLLAAAAAWVLFPWRGSLWQRVKQKWRTPGGVWPLLAVWAAVTLAIPTIMQTKLPWYFNTFFPLFALCVALSLGRVVSARGLFGARWRSAAIVVTFALAFGVAEGKLLWYSWHHRDLGLSEQSLLIDARRQLDGQRVYFDQDSRADYFVVEAVVGATPARVSNAAAFMIESRQGDYLLSPASCNR